MEVPVTLSFSSGHETTPELSYRIRRATPLLLRTDNGFHNLHYNRSVVAAQYIRGSGIELGALTTPQGVPPGVKVTYVDQARTEELRAKYGENPHITHREFVNVGVVSDAHTLAEIEDASQDFVLVHDVIEHLENPILAIKNWLRVLRPEGVLLFSAPDKRFTFDYLRAITPFDHLERDYRHGPEWSRLDAYLEWHRRVSIPWREPMIEASVDAGRAAHGSMLRKDDIHFHVWTHVEILELCTELKRKLGFEFEFEMLLQNEGEMIIALRKTRFAVYDRARPETAGLSFPL